MALSNLEKALIERLQEPQLDGESLIDGGLTAAANIVHEITRIQAPDDEAPADYIRRAVQEVASDLTVGLALAVNTYKKHSGFEFNTQSGTPTDYLIEMAKRHKQLFEAPQAVDTQAGIQEAAMLISSRAGMPFLPGESYGNYLARVADRLHDNYAKGAADIVIKLRDTTDIRFDKNESNDDYVRRIGEIVKRACKPKQTPFTELFELIFGLSGIKPEIKLEDFKENAYEYLTQIAELINKNKKPE